MNALSNPRAVGKVLRTRDGSSIMVVAGYAEAHPYSVVLVHGNEADVMGHFDDVQEAREVAEEVRRDREGPPQNNPYRTEHAARQHSPKGYKSCGRVTIHHDDKPIGLITCSPTGRRAHDTEVQSVRFPVEYWTPAAAKKWLRDHGYDDSRFEAAQPHAKRNGAAGFLVGAALGAGAGWWAHGEWDATSPAPSRAKTPKGLPEATADVTPAGENFYAVLKAEIVNSGASAKVAKDTAEEFSQFSDALLYEGKSIASVRKAVEKQYVEMDDDAAKQANEVAGVMSDLVEMRVEKKFKGNKVEQARDVLLDALALILAANLRAGGTKRNPGMDVANEILRQLGGNRFIAMTGAKHIMGDENSLVCKLGRFPGVKVQMLRVTLDPDDTYTMEFMAIRNHEAKVLDSVSGVYADSLRRVFEEHTGLRTSL